MTRTESGRLQTSPRIPSSGSRSRAPPVPSVDLVTVADPLDTDSSVRHSRNASHSTTQTLAPAPRPGLRTKKSLPDLRLSHADILAERRTGTTLGGADDEPSQPGLPSLDGPLRRFREERVAGPARSVSDRGLLPPPQEESGAPSMGRSASAHLDVSPSGLLGQEGPARPSLQGRAPSFGAMSKVQRADEPGDLERNSGAYFRRLSMLPESTIAKTVPAALLRFAETIRGILFALSQVHSALRQFVVFAAQDRLPAPVARLMGSADSSMSTLINALDRFDSLSRRATPPTAIVRDVFVACRDSVGTFGALVTALQPQLAVLTASADVRYSRTLVLMLYGSVGEIASSWASVVPLLADLDDPSVATLVLQPPTPSATFDPSFPSSSSSSDGPALRLTRQRSTTRRHAGSFSVEDVALGANLPPADIPPVPALPGGPLIFDESVASGSYDPNGGATLRTRPTPGSAKSSMSSSQGGSGSRAPPPAPLSMPPQMGYEQMVQKAFEHPITPGGLFLGGGGGGSGDSRAPSRAGSISGSAGIPPMPPMPSSGSSSLAVSGAGASNGSGSSMAVPASFHPHRISRPVSTLNADETFVDTADSTVSIASDVYGMLLDSFEDPALASQFAAIGKRRLKELAELCKAGYDSTQRLQRAIERVRGDDARGRLKFATAEARRLGDASYEFVSVRRSLSLSPLCLSLTRRPHTDSKLVLAERDPCGQAHQGRQPRLCLLAADARGDRPAHARHARVCAPAHGVAHVVPACADDGGRGRGGGGRREQAGRGRGRCGGRRRTRGAAAGFCVARALRALESTLSFCTDRSRRAGGVVWVHRPCRRLIGSGGRRRRLSARLSVLTARRLHHQGAQRACTRSSSWTVPCSTTAQRPTLAVLSCRPSARANLRPPRPRQHPVRPVPARRAVKRRLEHLEQPASSSKVSLRCALSFLPLTSWSRGLRSAEGELERGLSELGAGRGPCTITLAPQRGWLVPAQQRATA